MRGPNTFTESLFSIKKLDTEHMLMEQVHYNLLLRWFIGMSMDDAVGCRRRSAKTVSG